MYYAILLSLAGVGIFLTQQGFRRRRVTPIALGATLIVASLGFFSLLDLWGELLWFEALGYEQRFWTVLGVKSAALVAGALLGAGGVLLVGMPLRKVRPDLAWLAVAAGGTGGAVTALNSWNELLLYFAGEPTATHDPILGMDTGFYLFALPLYDHLSGLLTWIALVSLTAAIAAALQLDLRTRAQPDAAPPFEPLFVATAVLGLAIGVDQGLAVFDLMFSEWGVVFGPGWTDANVRLPAHLLFALLCLVLALFPLMPWFQDAVRRFWADAPQWGAIAVAWSAIGVAWVLALVLAPAATQWLLVSPNEITLESPYIANNIRFTRDGFGLHDVEERQFAATGRFTSGTAEANRDVLDNVRLWDWQALDAVYKQFQEIRLYYEFSDVDIDRYTIDGEYRQVMVSAREMAPRNLPADSRTFVNLRFIYTHGYGLTLAPVSEFTSNGLPRLLIRDIPPVWDAPELAVTRPEIYYGELTRSPVVVNTSEPEFDYPKGEENQYARYSGSGGVVLSSLWRKFLFGWKFDGTRFFLSSYPTPESRIMFNRQVRARVATVAPFLEVDRDPYLVLADGRLFWIVDAYTTSEHYPYSTPFSSTGPIRYGVAGSSVLAGANYVRNSVKVVVDAYEGSVDLYVFAPDDPLIQAWRKVFPDLFRDREQMPPALRAHIRYPHDLLLTQGRVYAKYHMTNPEVFYNQEDLWVLATEKYYDSVVPVEPYYVMWKPPEAEQAEFALILPFTPKNRQVLIGWIAGLCDGDNYGRFIAYKFPKDKRVLGPQQVETKIDQDRFLAGQLTLWDQRGSRVIRGNVLAIPIGETLLYVEPIYLEAETAAYPELRLITLMHGDELAYGESFEEALQALLGEAEQGRETAPASLVTGTVGELARQADQAFRDYLQLQAEQRFDEAAARLESLRDLLQRLTGMERDTPSQPQE